MPALSRLAELMAHADTDSVSLQAARDLLNRAGFKVVEADAEQHQVTVRVTWEDHEPNYLSQPQLNGHTLVN